MNINLGKLLVAAGMLLYTSLSAQAATYYVATNGNDSNSGTSAAAAKLTVQAAIDAASAGDEVQVGAGTYLLDSAIVLKERVNLKGSSAILDGQSKTRVLHQDSSFTVSGANTVIEGFTVQNGALFDNNSYGAGAYLRNKITLRSCIFRNNAISGRNASGAGAYFGGMNNQILSSTFEDNSITTSEEWSKGTSSGKGAGLYVESGSNTVEQCTLRNNTITNAYADNIFTAMGAGLYCGSKNAVSACIFSENKIEDNGRGNSMGGGAYTLAQTVVNGCTITGNQIVKTGSIAGSAQGGGIHLNSSDLQNCDVSENTVSYTAATSDVATYTGSNIGGGGIYANFSSKLNKNTVNRNTVSYSVTLPAGATLNANHIGGGGIHCYSSYAKLSNNRVCDNVFREEISGGTVGTKSGGGGGIYAVNIGSTLIDSCIAYSNTASGAALGRGGALYLINTTQLGVTSATNCDIRNNSAEYGGGAYLSKAALISSLVANNLSSVQGGGLLLTGACDIIGCSVLRNSSTMGAANIYNEPGSHIVLYSTVVWGAGSSVAPSGSFNAEYSAIQGVSAGTGGVSISGNNPDTNGPNFVNPTSFNGKATSAADSLAVFSADWELQANSPLIDKGAPLANNIIERLPLYDLLNNPRRCNSTLDIGAFEFRSMNCTAIPPVTTPNPDIRWDSILRTLTYGNTLTLNASISANNTITYISSDPSIAEINRNVVTARGVGVVEIIAQQSDNEWNFVRQTLTLAPREITVLADYKSKVTGESDPPLTYSITSGNLLSGDAFTGELTRVAGEEPGVYPIEQGTLALSKNYELTFIEGNFVITDNRPHGSSVYYVTPDGMDSNNGASWEMAKSSIQAAIAVAAQENPKASVWIKKGSYTISRELIMVEGVNVYGSFEGTESSLDERPPVVTGDTSLFNSFTLIDGGSTTLLLNQLYPFADSTTWDGITFVNGKNSGSGGGVVLRLNGMLNSCNVYGCHSAGSGGGVICNRGGSIVNSYVGNNRSDMEGGGVYCLMGSMVNTVVDRNTSGSNGGGVYASFKSQISESAITYNFAGGHGGGTYGSHGATLTLCHITDNIATGNGGGTYGDGLITMENSTINDNIATMGGGMYLREGGSALLCEINDNRARQNGGGVFFYNGGKISNGTISNNTAENGGGVFFSEKETGTLLKVTVKNNEASLHGGGLYFDNNGTASGCTILSNKSGENGGGVYFNQTGRCDSGFILHNTATYGGGVYVRRGGTAVNDSVAYNTATESGGGFYLNAATTITKGVVMCNAAAKDGGGIFGSVDSKISRLRIINNTAGGSGGGIFLDRDNQLVSSLVSHNSAANGGGILAKRDNSIINCTLVRNHADENGGGIHYTSGSKLTNSVVWGNSSQVYISGGSHDITYCAVESDTITNDSIAGTGNIRLSRSNIFAEKQNQPPLFTTITGFIGAGISVAQVDSALRIANWRSLTESTVYVNKGDNEAIPQGYYLDVAGVPRIYSEVVDYGAYEWVPRGYTHVVKPSAAGLLPLTIYPNPATNGYATLDLRGAIWQEGNRALQIKVYNLSGTLMATYPAAGEQTNINISQLPNGLYVVRAGKYVGKVVKR